MSLNILAFSNSSSRLRVSSCARLSDKTRTLQTIRITTPIIRTAYTKYIQMLRYQGTAMRSTTLSVDISPVPAIRASTRNVYMPGGSLVYSRLFS